MVMRPCNAAKLVDDDGQVIPVPAKLPEQVVQPLAFGHEHCRPQQGPDIQFRGAAQLKEIFGQKYANDVLALAFIDRETGMRSINDDTQQFIAGRMDVDKVHARSRNHHVSGRHFSHAKHTFEHESGFGTDDIVVLGISERLDQFSSGIRSRVDEFSELLEECALVILFGQARGLGIRHEQNGLRNTVVEQRQG